MTKKEKNEETRNSKLSLWTTLLLWLTIIILFAYLVHNSEDNNLGYDNILQNKDGENVSLIDYGNITVYGNSKPIGQYYMTQNDTRFLFFENCELIINTEDNIGILCNNSKQNIANGN